MDFTNTRNGKRHGTENGMKRKTKWKVRSKTKSNNFVDATAYKGKRFEKKQNLDFRNHFKSTIHFNIWTSLKGKPSALEKYK